MEKREPARDRVARHVYTLDTETFPMPETHFSQISATLPTLCSQRRSGRFWNPVEIERGGYPFDSPHPKGLCFADRFLLARVNYLVASDRIDGDGLLRQAIEQLPAAA